MSMAYAWASPSAVSALTLPQLFMCLGNADTTDSAAPPANAFRSAAERQAYVDAVRKRKGTG